MSNPYFPFFPNDHLGDINLRGCHPAAKGIWWDMVCYMAQGSPFGHLRLDPAKTAPPPGRPPALASGIPPGTPPARARAGARGVPGGVLQIEYNLPKSGSLEHELPRMLGLPANLVEWALAHLENRQVFSRTREGIIYCRRMVRWAEEREARKRRATEAYQRRQRNGQNGPPGQARSSAPAPPPGRAGGTPPGTPPGRPRGLAAAPPPGTPTGPPNTLALDTTNPTPLPPPRKRGVGADRERTAELIEQRLANRR